MEFLKKHNINIEQLLSKIGKKEITLKRWEESKMKEDNLMLIAFAIFSQQINGLQIENKIQLVKDLLNSLKPEIEKKTIEKELNILFNIEEKVIGFAKIGDKTEDEINQYFETAEEIIRGSKRQINIYDYFSKSQETFFTRNDKFLDRNRAYYGVIEGKLKEGIEYKRVLALPVNLKEEEYISKEGIINGDFYIMSSINLMFLSTFEHIWKCFNQYNDFFQLYVCSKSPKNYSFCCADKKFLVLEIDRFDENGTPRLDILLTINPTNQGQTEILETTKELNRSFNSLVDRGNDDEPPVWKLSKKLFEAATISLHKIVAEKEKEKRGKIADINSATLPEVKEYEAIKSNLDLLKRKRAILAGR